MENITVGIIGETAPLRLTQVIDEIIGSTIFAGQRFTEDELCAIRYVVDELEYIQHIGKYTGSNQMSKINIDIIRKMINE